MEHESADQLASCDAQGSSDSCAFISSLPSVTIITGHYGVGKSSLSLNITRDLAQAGYDTTLVDLDIVNPYFRVAEYRASLEKAGVTVAAPAYSEAGTSLDIPALTVAVGVLADEAYAHPDTKRLVIDVGGDDVGSFALGRYVKSLEQGPYAMLYVVNAFRSMTQTANEAQEILQEIEAASRLTATALVSNAHLKDATTAQDIVAGFEVTRSLAESTGLSIACVTAPITLVQQEKDYLSSNIAPVVLYPITQVVTTPWEA